MAAHFLDGQLGLDAKHGVNRAGHAEVGKVRGAVRKNLLVGGLNMSMGSDNGGNAAVKVVSDTFLLAGRLGMEVDDGDFRQARSKNAVRSIEGIVERLHIDDAHEIDDADLHAAHVIDEEPAARRAVGEIGGAQKRFAGIVSIVRLDRKSVVQ